VLEVSTEPAPTTEPSATSQPANTTTLEAIPEKRRNRIGAHFKVSRNSFGMKGPTRPSPLKVSPLQIKRLPDEMVTKLSISSRPSLPPTAETCGEMWT